MAENSTTKTKSYCHNCKTVLEGCITCPECGLSQLTGLLQFLDLADDDAKQLLENYDRERGRNNQDKIKKLFKTADSWRRPLDYTEEFVKDVVKVLHFNEDGDIEIRKVAKMGTVTKTREANAAKVLEYMEEAASLGSLPALVLVAKYYLGGYGCKRKTLNAIALLCRAAIAGNRESYRLLVQGDEFYAGDFVGRIPSDILSSTSYDKYYVNNLTNLKSWEKRENPLPMLERFMQSNMLWARYVLGEMYLRGNSFVGKDIKKGIDLILSAADKGPYHVQRAIKAKALLQFDKLIELNGQNNVDAAIKTHWRIENLRVRREAQAEMLSRTSIVESHAGEVVLNFNSRGAQLVWRAMKHFKEVNNASWITLPNSEKACKKLSKRMFGYDFYYRGKDNSVKKDGKNTYYRAPFLGYNGLWSTYGLIFDCKTGLYGNLHPKKKENGYLFEYGNQYNYKVGDFEFRGDEEVDISWLFREPEYRSTTNGMYIYWGQGWKNPVDFNSAGFSELDLLTLIDYVRRYVFSDLRKGVRLSDGSIQKGQFSSKIELPLTASKHTLAIMKKINGEKSMSSGCSTSQKKRWKFVTLGMLLGILGLQFLYARRIGWFLLYWLTVGVTCAQYMVASFTDLIVGISPKLASMLTLGPISMPMLGVVEIPTFGLLAGLILLGSIFFMKKDGAGARMQ